MSTQSIRRRMEAIARIHLPSQDGGTMTLEQLLRCVWQQDHQGYMRLVSEHDTGACLLLPKFRREDELAKAEPFGRAAR